MYYTYLSLSIQQLFVDMIQSKSQVVAHTNDEQIREIPNKGWLEMKKLKQYQNM